MKEKEHAAPTPGPWVINGEGFVIAKVSHHAITAPCTANTGSLSREVVAANALLVTVAPDMHEALLAIKADPHGCPRCDSGRLRDPGKGHWERCGFRKLEDALAKVGSETDSSQAKRTGEWARAQRHEESTKLRSDLPHE